VRVEVYAGGAELAARAADIIGATAAGREAALALPTGHTPLPVYAELARRAAAGALNLRAAAAFAIDEFAGVPTLAAGTNAAFFREHLHFTPRALHVPDAGAADPAEEICTFAGRLQDAGDADLCVLGIGRNGHIAFNEPGSPAEAPARVVTLAEETRAAHAEAFGGLANVPETGMTLGVADILRSKAVLVLARGAHKAAPVRDAIEGAPSERVPASWLQRHGDVTWLLDPQAASLLSPVDAR
jgi:glucosamine-6-phosphate deaminase